jgi:hypothetical protein
VAIDVPRDAVDTAVFCPAAAARDGAFLVQVFAYPPVAAAEVDAKAREADSDAGRRGTYSLPLDIPHGTRMDLRLEMPGLTITEPDAVMMWRGGPTSVQFEVGVPSTIEQPSVIGRVRIALDGIPAGTLRFQVRVVSKAEARAPAEPLEVRARRYRRAFVSYSSQDRGEVLRRVQAFKIAGLSIFQDVLDLEPGERWEQSLYREIDNCDVFLLFWSRAAAASPGVQKEIEYALGRKGGDSERPPDIQPVPIEGPPIPEAPPSLSGLHFNDALLAQIAVASGPRVDPGPAQG